MNQRVLHHDAASANDATQAHAPSGGTVRLTTAQALVRYLAAQRVTTEDGSGTEPLFGGVFAIFGHGNVAGIGEALVSAPRSVAHTARAQRTGDGA